MRSAATTLIMAYLTIGCSGVRPRDEPVMASDHAVDPSADPSNGSSFERTSVVMTYDPAPEVDSPAPAPAAAPAPAPDPPEAVAEAALDMVGGASAAGWVTFAQSHGRVVIAGTFSGLKPGLRGFLVHEGGDCRAEANRAADHFNPTNARHGPPESSQRHAGDFGNLLVDERGAATFAMTTDSLTVTAGPDSVVGRTIAVHARRDDGATQPAGDAGPAVACGLIEMQAVAVAGP
jgi:Cu-Zn family superoxide dismutase